jgi:hypothetical protein
MTKLTFKASEFGPDQLGVYVSGRYCGTIQRAHRDHYVRLRRYLGRNKELLNKLVECITQGRSRPLGGFVFEAELIDRLSRSGYLIDDVLYVKAGRGLLWSPACWSMVCHLVRNYR